MCHGSSHFLSTNCSDIWTQLSHWYLVLLQVLRLVCIQCISNNGFRQKLLDYYKREIIQVRTVSKNLPFCFKVDLVKICVSRREYHLHCTMLCWSIIEMGEWYLLCKCASHIIGKQSALHMHCLNWRTWSPTWIITSIMGITNKIEQCI